MQKSKNDYWFPAKKYGFGWGLPVKWQGWVVVLIYFVLITAGIVLIEYNENKTWFFIYCSIPTILLILICWKKGEPAKWRWGNKH